MTELNGSSSRPQRSEDANASQRGNAAKRRKRALACLALAACAGGASDGKNPLTDARAGGDAPVGCQVTLSFSPSIPHAGASIRGVASVTNPGGFSQYAWDVRFQNAAVTTMPAAADDSQVDFFAADPGTYVISVEVSGGSFCEPALAYLNVLAPGAGVADYRLHAFPPASLAPPQDTIIEVDGGADAYRAVALDPGITPTVQLTDGTNPVSGYVRFVSATSPTASVEVYAGVSGTITPRVLGQPYSVLVVPATNAVAPALLSWTPGMQQLVVPTGSVVTGSVLDASGVGLAGATVQLTANGVPSTIATTAANGSFSLREAFPTGATVTVDVTPPAGRGLPRLSATGVLDLSQGVHVSYASSLATTCDLSGTAVQRASTNQPGAQVTVVGTIANVGSVACGTTNATADGTVRIAATADGTGKLPTTLVPRASLSAVVQLAANDYAVSALDTTSCAAGAIAAPAGATSTGTITDASANTLGGVHVQAATTHELALAGVPATEATTDQNGQFTMTLASGGQYDLRFADPYGRAASLVIPDVGAIPTSQSLPKALHLSGTVSVVGSANPVTGAALQLLCATCSGLAATQPIAEAATDHTSMFVLAVPDPGTM